MITSMQLAASGSTSLFLTAAGVLVAALLIGAFWYGSRRTARRRDPGARPAEQSPQAQARSDSWRTPGNDGDERQQEQHRP
ncbi:MULTISPECIES: DUF6479 family protein [unclassified Streptomyces]|uniref:DUF6479 family protein n=1 Tax=unclassified Streptomyces TaxID=2593676 RepID=UPI0004BD7429|nr:MULTISPECIES: DUF6479 family protein [unclassified Streptomyces]